MKILALDSSGLVASAAYLVDGVMVAEYTVNDKLTHSQTRRYVRAYDRHDCYIPRAKIHIGRFRIRVHADDQFHLDHRPLGSDGGNHIEEGLSRPLPGVGRIPSVDHHELLYLGCGDPCNPKRV